METKSSERWTAVAGFVDARGVVVGFLVERPGDGQHPLTLCEPVGQVRELSIEELKAAVEAGDVRAG